MSKTDEQMVKDEALESLLQASDILAVDLSKDLLMRHWRKQMDITRMVYGRSRTTPQGRPRTCHIFTLTIESSNCSLEDFRDLAKTWAEKNFRGNGRFHEYAILYRFESGSLQANVVVNALDKMTKRKLRIWGGAHTELVISVREIGEELGLGKVNVRSWCGYGPLSEGGLR